MESKGKTYTYKAWKMSYGFLQFSMPVIIFIIVAWSSEE